MHSAANLLGWPASQNPQISGRLLERGSQPIRSQESAAGQTGRVHLDWNSNAWRVFVRRETDGNFITFSCPDLYDSYKNQDEDLSFLLAAEASTRRDLQ